MSDRLRPLWDFGDLDATERRFRELGDDSVGASRAEVLSQLARVEGLRGRFEEADRLLDEAEGLAGGDPSALVRIDLERGRALRSRGDAEAAAPLFERAFRRCSGLRSGAPCRGCGAHGGADGT